MSKETSVIIKGVAILMMLWFHLFGISELEDLCTPLFYINGKPLVAYIHNACHPVPFFLILSGYGLTYIYNQQRLNIKSQAKRILKIYIHYWIVLLIFVSIGHFIKPDDYPNDFIHIISNITSVRCTYNGEVWFLFPYSIICLFSQYIVNYVYNINSWKKTAIATSIYVILFTIAKLVVLYLPEQIVIYTTLIQFHRLVILLFYFILGILLFRFLEKNRVYSNNKPIVYALSIIILFIVKSMFKVTLIDGIYAFIFIWCFVHLPLNKYLRKTLFKLGSHSMVMWMTHTFFCVYLFRDFIYDFKYPLIIYIVLVTVCYITAQPIMWISNKIIKIFSL